MADVFRIVQYILGNSCAGGLQYELAKRRIHTSYGTIAPSGTWIALCGVGLDPRLHLGYGRFT